MVPDRDASGAATLELILMVPVIALFMLFIVGAGRVPSVRADVEGAARDAARAASLAETPSEALSEADDFARRALSERGRECESISVETDLADFRPGGDVAVDVACRLGFSDLGAPFPSAATFRGHFVAPIDRFVVLDEG